MSTIKLAEPTFINQNRVGVLESVYHALINQKCTITLVGTGQEHTGVLRAVDQYSILFEERVNDATVQYHSIMKSALQSIIFEPEHYDDVKTNMKEYVFSKNNKNNGPKVRKKFTRKSSA